MITAIANQKGGVAKTTSTIALAGLLAHQGSSCLAVDLDPQGNLTTGLGVEVSEGQLTTYEVFTEQALVLDAVVETRYDISLLPTDISLAKVEKELINQEGRFYTLRQQLETVKDKFEYILIDCPPSMGLLTINALAAADSLLVPVQCQFFALKGLEAVLQTIQTVKEKLNPDLKVLGVLPTMAEKNTVITQDILKTLRNQLDGIKVFDPVPKSVKFAESNLAGEPIHVYAGEWRLVQPYREVIREILLLEEAMEEEEED
ncbi:ParA family protein [Oscillatoria sp. FACHB-1407]|uniref:ParA family protein n=1 Tax=Oscillatoria sp. FACHB-1407 TaxID=2692847 RepID=UPI001684D0DD|nr:AAA family ATPase [Oscillatoria sp. FACHB-1407]MBD2464554.1 ParA family protein [Oscillatoria sp. FACHB-1407]